MAVKTAVGEVCCPHDVGDADAAEALGAKQPAGRIEDAFARLGGFFPAHSHVRSTHDRKRLTNHMMTIINTQQKR